MEKPKGNELIDEVLRSADLSDRAWMFLNKYKKQIIIWTTACCVVLATLGFSVVIYNSEIEAMQNAFTKLETDEQKLAFAKKYKSKQLGGIVFMELADRAYRAGDFETAAGMYNDARVSLGKSIPGGRAEIGYSMALLRAGKTDLAKQSLLKLSQESSMPQGAKAEALMLLARLFCSHNDRKNANAVIEQVASGNFSKNWKTRAKDLRREMEI
ncbi:MAG: hypothetical protein LBB20_02130 [Puniceicoccales bacterium]|jgi:hypothetical protein|nr:hypothetical protein [Puniceicoccales bacterium]